MLVTVARAQSQQGIRSGEIELRLAQLNPTSGLFALYWNRGARELFVDSVPMVEPMDVESVQVSRHRGRVVFDIILKPQGDQRVALRTADYTDRYIAFLVEGQLVDAFELKGRVGGTLTRWHALSVEESALPPGSVERIERRYGKDTRYK